MWINRVRLATVLGLWLGGHVRVGRPPRRPRRARRGACAARKELDAARADEERLRRGRVNATWLLTLGQLDEDEFRAAVAASDGERAEVVERIAGIEARAEALSRDADLYERIERESDGMTAEQWHAVLRRANRRVVVSAEVVVIEPWRGEPTTDDRPELTPRRPHRGAAETAHGPDGKFVGGA